MTDADVIELYRCLLGRAPENAETISAFRHYYPDFDSGRRAVFEADEFQLYYARVTGKIPLGTESAGAALALEFLARAGKPAKIVPSTRLNPVLRRGFAIMLERLEYARLAVVVGELPGGDVADLVPFGKVEAAALQIGSGFPAKIPRSATLPDGTALFQISAEPAEVASLVKIRGLKIDALYLLSAPAGLEWLEQLQPFMAPQSLIVLGPESAKFDAPVLSDAIGVWRPHDAAIAWQGLTLHHLGGWHMPVTYQPTSALPVAPERADYPSLALAAIVKNESACVLNMLQSVLPVTAFFAVLDTGSTDDTAALVKRFVEASGVAHALGALQSERFDEMRNAALDMVPAWVDWILMLDADEELVAEDLTAVLDLIVNSSFDVYALPRYNFVGPDKSREVVPYPDRQARLFRNDAVRPVRYSGAVHETIRSLPRGMPALDASAIGGDAGGPHIHHLVRRFRDDAAEEKKQAFYREIARRYPG